MDHLYFLIRLFELLLVLPHRIKSLLKLGTTRIKKDWITEEITGGKVGKAVARRSGESCSRGDHASRGTTAVNKLNVYLLRRHGGCITINSH